MTSPKTDAPAPAQPRTAAQPGTDLVTVRVRFFAAAAEAAGTHEGTYELLCSPTAAQLVAALTRQHGAELGRILSISSLLASGVPVADHTAPLTDYHVDVLPPFAGG